MKTYLLACGLVLNVFGSVAYGYGVNLEARLDAGNDKVCLDVRGDQAREGTVLIVWNCHGRENQRWAVTDGVNGDSAFIGVGGYCLDVRGAIKTDGAQIELWKCHFGPNQRFRVTEGLIVEVGSGKCLVAKDSKSDSLVVLGECKDPKAKWHLVK